MGTVRSAVFSFEAGMLYTEQSDRPAILPSAVIACGCSTRIVSVAGEAVSPVSRGMSSWSCRSPKP